MHDLANSAERGAYFFAAVSAVSLWQGVALAVTIIAGLVSIILGCVKLYDRFGGGK